MKNEEQTRLTRKEQAVQTRRRLFDKALEIFARTDMDEVPVKDLCAAAGVSVGTFYNYFQTKEDLLLEAYHFFDEEVVTKARARTRGSNLDALYSILEYQCGHYQGLFDDGDSLSFAIEQHYLAGELLLWKQVLRILLRNGGSGVIEPNRPMNVYVRELVGLALADGELVSGDETSEEIADTVLRVSRGTIFDWATRNGPYCLYEQAVDDVKHYLKAFMP